MTAYHPRRFERAALATGILATVFGGVAVAYPLYAMAIGLSVGFAWVFGMLDVWDRQGGE